jgi:hypothetical protein
MFLCDLDYTNRRLVLGSSQHRPHRDRPLTGNIAIAPHRDRPLTAPPLTAPSPRSPLHRKYRNPHSLQTVTSK